MASRGASEIKKASGVRVVNGEHPLLQVSAMEMVDGSAGGLISHGVAGYTTHSAFYVTLPLTVRPRRLNIC